MAVYCRRKSDEGPWACGGSSLLTPEKVKEMVRDLQDMAKDSASVYRDYLFWFAMDFVRAVRDQKIVDARRCARIFLELDDSY